MSWTRYAPKPTSTRLKERIGAGLRRPEPCCPARRAGPGSDPLATVERLVAEQKAAEDEEDEF